MNKTIGAISPETMEVLVRYAWPGNIRELQNIIERSVVIHERGNLTVKKSWLCHESFLSESPALSSFATATTGERERLAQRWRGRGAECQGHRVQRPFSVFRRRLLSQESGR